MSAIVEVRDIVKSYRRGGQVVALLGNGRRDDLLAGQGAREPSVTDGVVAELGDGQGGRDVAGQRDRGDELACLAELSRANLTRAGLRMTARPVDA